MQLTKNTAPRTRLASVSFVILFSALLGSVSGATAFAATTRVQWLGHAAFQLTTPEGKVLLIDPWLKNPMNPAGKDGKNPVIAVGRTDYILITHGHSDHVGEAVELAKKTGAKLVASVELGGNLVAYRGFPKAQAQVDTLMNIGGELHLSDEVNVSMTPAVHSSGLDKTPGSDHPEIVYGGNPVGFIIKIKNGPTLYHTGDTAYFSDMKLIGESFAPDLALINIGGHFGMSPQDAARAAEAVQAKLVVPHHFRTMPLLTQDPGPFFKALDEKHIAHREMKPGETLEFEGTQVKK